MKENQLELFVFKTKVEKEHNCDTKVCTKCGIEKPLEYFYKAPMHKAYPEKNYRFSTCITCFKYNAYIKRRLIKQHKCNQTTCDCCGKKSDKLNLDHDHKTNEFRGWLCYHCNTALGKLGDDIEGVTKALRYLQRHEEKNG